MRPASKSAGFDQQHFPWARETCRMVPLTCHTGLILRFVFCLLCFRRIGLSVDFSSHKRPAFVPPIAPMVPLHTFSTRAVWLRQLAAPASACNMAAAGLLASFELHANGSTCPPILLPALCFSGADYACLNRRFYVRLAFNTHRKPEGCREGSGSKG